jgi:PIN domain
VTGSQTPWVVLDATVLNRADWYLERIPARLVLRECREGHLRLALPKVVMAECTAAHEREAHDTYRKMIELYEWLWEHRTHLYFHDFEPRDEPPTIAAYQPVLEGILKEAGATILPMPEVSHAELVERAVSRRQPFAPNGSGYRDALVWHSILELVKGSDDPVVLISNDRAAFTEKTANDKPKSDKPKLDGGLVEEVESAGRGGAVRLFFTLSEYVKTLGLPADAEVAVRWERRLLREEGFEESLLSAIPEACPAEPFWRAVVGANDGGHAEQFWAFKPSDLRVKTALVEDGRDSVEISVLVEYYVAGTSIPLDQSGGLSQPSPRAIQHHGNAEVMFEVREDSTVKSGFRLALLQVSLIEH